MSLDYRIKATNADADFTFIFFNTTFYIELHDFDGYCAAGYFWSDVCPYKCSFEVTNGKLNEPLTITSEWGVALMQNIKNFIDAILLGQ